MLGTPRELTELYGVARRRRLRLRALVASRKAVRIFERDGLEEASSYVASLGGKRTRRRVAAVDTAVDLAWRFRVVGRLLRGQERCLPECVGICAGLRAMGCEAEI